MFHYRLITEIVSTLPKEINIHCTLSSINAFTVLLEINFLFFFQSATLRREKIEIGILISKLKLRNCNSLIDGSLLGESFLFLLKWFSSYEKIDSKMERIRNRQNKLLSKLAFSVPKSLEKKKFQVRCEISQTYPRPTLTSIKVQF